MEALAGYYPDTVNFYGSNKTRSKLMEEKRKFALRWPIRQFTIRTISADCAATCTASGIVAWDTGSEERNDHSIGTAGFRLAIAPNPDGSQTDGAILSENGSVLSVHKEPLHLPPQAAMVQQPPAISVTSSLSPGQQNASTTDAYVAGRQDRANYESWYAGLPTSPYRDGATFWAGNRSSKPQPTCAQIGTPPDWQQGCRDAQARLATSDLRRKADKNYWWGWNSL